MYNSNTIILKYWGEWGNLFFLVSLLFVFPWILQLSCSLFFRNLGVKNKNIISFSLACFVFFWLFFFFLVSCSLLVKKKLWCVANFFVVFEGFFFFGEFDLIFFLVIFFVLILAH